MNNYLFGFGISFSVHSLVLGLTLFFVQTNIQPSPELLVVDFSNISLGPETIRGVSGSPGSAEMGPGSEETLAKAEPVQEYFLPPAEERPLLSEADLLIPTVVKPIPEVVKKVEPKPVPKPLKKKQPTATPKKVEKEQPTTARPEEKSEVSAQADALATGSSRSAANTGASSMGPGNGSQGQGEKQHSGSGSGGNNGREATLVREYVRNNFNYILVRVRRNLDYPAQARRMGFSGVCKYSFAINMDGQISELQVVESSGHQVLDEAGKKAILRSSPFPVPPTPARIIIPIKFSLTG